ncbi:riboflavin synthase [Candidatus Uhrbacteria bacterium]|nr:riboflavin synthase [Candidatus Uhrbacteria bacterium]
MFTGIIQSVGVITALEKKNSAVTCTINPLLRRKWKKGESVSINGICSTIISVTGHSFLVAYMPHTVHLTTVKRWKKGTRVNIEPSLKAGDEISGHFVTGHIDGVARIVAMKYEKEQTTLSIQVPRKLLRYSIPRGSITINGVSLTIASVKNAKVTVKITPYTLSHTTLQYTERGASLNLEIDMLARYLLWKNSPSKKRKRA